MRQWDRIVLERMGITDVTYATDGREALRLVTQPGTWFDLILCDLQTPDRDGVEAIRAFAAMRLESAVILSVMPEQVAEVAALLADEQGVRLLGTIAKPLSPEKLEPLLVQMHTPGMEASDTTPTPEEAIRDAFLHGELEFLYQPKVDMATWRLTGVEALARWRHPQFGTFKPDVFVPLCDKSDDHGDRHGHGAKD